MNYKDKELEDIKNTTEPALVVSKVFAIVERQGRKVYLLVDEYDNFTNELIAVGEDNIYRDLLHGTGFVKTFYKEIKSATQSETVSKIFITGVSPITIDDLTSGFNILNNITLAEDLNYMMGFNETDMTLLLDTFLNDNKEIKISKEVLTNDLAIYYNGYLFNYKGKERIFNPDMALYFLKEMNVSREYPQEILDMNVRTDYEKVKKLLRITSSKDKRIRNIEKLKEIITEGVISSEIITNFPLERIADTENFVSLMFYLGLLTIDKREQGELKLKIPNYVIRKVYWNYLDYMLKNEGNI